MPMFLRSLLREIITDLSGPASPVGEPTGEPTMHYLIVVARNEPALYEHLRDRHGRDPRVRVVVDRRGASDVEITESRPRVGRRRRRSWLSPRAAPELGEPAGEGTPQSLSRRPTPRGRPAGAPR